VRADDAGPIHREPDVVDCRIAQHHRVAVPTAAETTTPGGATAAHIEGTTRR
jgi:hypothetical protein